MSGATDELKRRVHHEIHRLEMTLDEARSNIDALKLLLTEIKWVQEQEELHEGLQ